MGLFSWLTAQFRAAASRGVVLGLADVGLVAADATPEDVRKAIEGKAEAVEDRPATKGAKSK